MQTNFEDGKFFIKQAINFYKNRGYTLRNDINPILEKAGLATKRSWDDTIRMIDNLSESPINTDIIAKITSEIAQDLMSVILYRDKIAFIYEDLENLDEIHSAINNASTPFNNDYSSIMDKTVDFNCVKIQEDGIDFYLYKSERVLPAKIDLGVYALKSEHLDEDFERVIAYKTIEITAFDMLIFDKNNKRLILSADLASKSPVENLQAQIAKLVRIIRSEVNATNNGSAGQVIKDLGIDLFSCIENLYKERAGKVKEMAFADDEGVSHRAKVRHGIEDARETAYHTAGAKAADVSVYDIYKVYQKENEVSIGMPWQQFQKDILVVSYAKISCKSHQGFCDIINKLVTFSKKK